MMNKEEGQCRISNNLASSQAKQLTKGQQYDEAIDQTYLLEAISIL